MVKYHTHSAIRSKSAFLMVIGAFLLTPFSDVNSATVTPHRAFYEMQLGSASQSSTVQTIVGRSAFTLDQDCSGWFSNEEYMIEFEGKEGRLNRILSSFESWESNKGDLYSFDVREQSSFQSNKDFRGYAKITAEDARAYFSMADDEAMQLPIDTYFPMQHLNAILDNAVKGEKIFAASVFTGAEPDDALLATNTVIGGWKGEKPDASMGEFGQEGFWPVQIAYFKPAATAAEPEYEINYSMQPNGVVRRYVIDYGDFSIIAQLIKLEALAKPKCP